MRLRSCYGGRFSLIAIYFLRRVLIFDVFYSYYVITYRKGPDRGNPFPSFPPIFRYYFVFSIWFMNENQLIHRCGRYY